MTLKDIYNYVNSDWCGGNCLRKLNNNGVCPYELGDFSYCAIDSVIISLDYLARGEYYG
jgi:hypothetical protein